MINIKLYMGLDLSLSNSGISIIDENNNIIYQTTIPTNKKLTESQRLMVIGNTLENVILEYKPYLTVIENTYLRTNVKTKQILDHIGGMARFLLGRYNLNYYFITTMTLKNYLLTNCKQPTKKQIKQGAIKRDLKEEMRIEIIKQYNLDSKTNNDLTDSLGLAKCALYNIQDPIKKPKIKKQGVKNNGDITKKQSTKNKNK